ncbi:DUF5615 family PIN-like protein [Sorangium sp. So ce1024]|uniref:DUF5615 family PIN-like protein n=1 Tax=unclassified Sorangium TaxID=2621164 RepID=UPI003F520FFD
MRIKLDENLPSSLVEALAQLGHDVDSVPQERLQGSSDPDIWAAAQAEGRFLVTQDLDFSDVRQFAPGTERKRNRKGARDARGREEDKERSCLGSLAPPAPLAASLFPAFLPLELAPGRAAGLRKPLNSGDLQPVRRCPTEHRSG